MTDEPITGQTEETEQAPGDAWKEVGKQFEALGQSLASAFRAAWESEENRRHLQNLQSGLESMVDEISQAANEMASSEKGQKVRAEVGKAAESARLAGQQALEDAQPHVLSALHRVNSELQKMISRIEQESSSEEAVPDDQPTE